ncbi:MAG TPA: hypothetical protein VFJ13_07080 [Paracoccaceae bacterium]|nr:hypothetical protein [Paracoccaceae bacterium]
MAAYNFRAHGGLTDAHMGTVDSELGGLVSYTAANVSWNRLSSAPAGFDNVEVTSGKSTTIVKTHTASGVTFSPGFNMIHIGGGSQKWEGRAVAANLRLDLQGITANWANFAIQTNGANSKTVATCLMEVGQSFSVGQLYHALHESAKRKEICEMTR